MVRASRSIVDPVKAYAAPVTPSNVTNLGGRNPAGACTLASLPRPLVADFVEKVRQRSRPDFFSVTGAIFKQGRGGPHRAASKRHETL